MLIKTLENIAWSGSSELSILESALNSGHIFEYSCKNGQCGVCKTTLLEGEIVELHEQIALTKSDKKNKRILACCCAPSTDILLDAEELSVLQNIEIKTLPARINNILELTNHIVEVELRLPPTAEFNFLEGQFVDVIGPQGVRRSYSIANSSDEKTIKLFIKKIKNGVLSEYWFHDAKKNDLLRVEGPKGSFFFREPKSHIVLLATGTGIAPVKSMLDRLVQSLELTKDLTFSLYWGNRCEEDFFWQPDYPQLKLDYVPVLSKANSLWQGRVGYIQNIAMEDGQMLNDTQVYACGSLQMIESAKVLFVKNGLMEKCFYADAFVSS